MEALRDEVTRRLLDARRDRMDAWVGAEGDGEPEAGSPRARLQFHFANLDDFPLADGIPLRYRPWRLYHFSPDNARDAVAFIEGGDASTLFLHGAVGTGKTSLAAAILHAWRWSGGGCNSECPTNCGASRREVGLFLPAYEAAARLRNLDRCEEAMAEWGGARLLVLDDIGANRATPHVTEQLLFLLQRRYDNCAKTVATSNLGLPGIEQMLGERAASRLQEGILIELTGGDKRGGGERPLPEQGKQD